MEPFAQYVVPESATLQEAMRCIDQSPDGTFALVSAGQRLVGLVTNGDIRRAIVHGRTLSHPVSDIMNASPIVLRRSDMQEPAKIAEAVGRVRDIGATVLPIVGDDGTLQELLVGPQLGAFLSRVLHRPDQLRDRRTRVLLVGGAGYIGTVLSKMLLDHGFAVRVADSLLYGAEPIAALLKEPQYEFFRADFRHIENMIDLVSDVDAVVYLAEIVGDPACDLNPSLALETNFISVLAFATLCSHLQVNRFVYLSSCSVYGANAGEAWLDETSALNPLSIYAQMKIKTEAGLFKLADDSSNFSPTILRLATVFGLSPRPRFDLVVNRMSALAVRQGRITVLGGDQWRPSVHVSDVARAILATLRAPIEQTSGQTFNVGDNRLNMTVRAIGEAVAREIPGTQIGWERGSVDARDYRVSFDRIRGALGFEATVSLSDGIREISEFLRRTAIDVRDPRFNNSHIQPAAAAMPQTR